MSQIDDLMRTADLPPSRNRHSVARRVSLVVTALAVVAGFLSFVVVARQVGTVQPEAGGPGTGAVTVTVRDGDSLREIALTLKAAGVISTAEGFLAAAEGDKRSGSLRAGTYSLKQGMTGSGALALMLDPSSFQSISVAIPEGLTTVQIVTIASRATGRPVSEFTRVLDDAVVLRKLGLPEWADGKADGLLFPATYDIATGATAEQVIGAMLRRFNQAADSVKLEQRAEKLGITPYDAVIVASLAQAEVVPDDFGLVSRVIYNRLARGDRLQLDSTVNFALGKREILLSADELATESPYNTYLVEGLPPTPINAPGESALRGAVEPEKGDWLYFVATDPELGETQFTADYDEFLRWKQEFRDKVAASQ